MFTVSRMSAASVSALALIALIIFFVIETRPQKKTLSMLDLAEFKELPGELRAIIKSMMPNGVQLKKHWAHMPQQQRQMVIQQLTSQFPRAPQHDNRPPAPSVVIKPDPPAVIEEKPNEVVDSSFGLKPGFLLTNGINKGKKKNPKNKKHDEVVTLRDVGASDDEGGSFVSTDADA